MARKLRWQLRFKSLAGKNCHVDIYKEGYTGNTVTQLTGGPSPFIIQEDDDDNLLSFIRVKTAYISLKETVYGELDDIIPETATEHFVKAYYGDGNSSVDTSTEVWTGGQLVFTGFVQVSEYANAWVAPPRDVELTVTSPLGLINEFTFTPMNQPSLVTLGSILKQVMEGMNADYQSVVYHGSSLYPWNNVMFYTVVCPFNSNFAHYSNASELYAPKSYGYFIEGLCNRFGWTVHDQGNILVFQKFDAENSTHYSELDVSNLDTLDPDQRRGRTQWAVSFSDNFENCNDKAKISVVRPLRQLTLNMEGALENSEMSTKHTTTEFGGLVSGINGNIGNRFVILSYEGTEVDGKNIGKASGINVDNIIPNITNINGTTQSADNGLCPIAFGTYGNYGTQVSLSEFWVTKYSTSWPVRTKLIHWRCFNILNRSEGNRTLLKLKIKVGHSLANLVADYTYHVDLVIKIGNLYYDLSSETWSSSVVYNHVTIVNGSVTPNYNLDSFAVSVGYIKSDANDLDGLLIKLFPNSNQRIKVNDTAEVMVYSRSEGFVDNNAYIVWDKIGFYTPSTLNNQYINSFNRNMTVILNNTRGDGIGEDSINVAFQNFDDALCSNSYADPQDQNAHGTIPTYAYMFTKQTWLNITVKMKSSVTGFELLYMYLNRWTFWIYGWRWRIVSFDLDLRNDEYTVTIVRVYGL